MKYLFFVFFNIVVLSSYLHAYTPVSAEDLQFLRVTYYSAVENEDDVETLSNFIVKKFGSDRTKYPPIILAYVGGIEALKSKHAFWITTKYSLLIKSMEIFEKAVEKDPNNLEIRFMRFSILHYVPSLLGYGKEREEDANEIFKLLMKKDFSLVNKEIQIGIFEFMISSERIDNASIKILQKELSLLR